MFRLHFLIVGAIRATARRIARSRRANFRIVSRRAWHPCPHRMDYPRRADCPRSRRADFIAVSRRGAHCASIPIAWIIPAARIFAPLLVGARIARPSPSHRLSPPRGLSPSRILLCSFIFNDLTKQSKASPLPDLPFLFFIKTPAGYVLNLFMLSYCRSRRENRCSRLRRYTA